MSESGVFAPPCQDLPGQRAGGALARMITKTAPPTMKSLTAADASALKRAGLERRKGCPGLFMLRDEDGFPLIPEEHPLEGRLKTLAEHLCAELARRLRDSGTEGLPVDDFGRADLKGVWLPAADLQGAHLEKATLLNANLDRADMRGAKLHPQARLPSSPFDRPAQRTPHGTTAAARGSRPPQAAAAPAATNPQTVRQTAGRPSGQAARRPSGQAALPESSYHDLYQNLYGTLVASEE